MFVRPIVVYTSTVCDPSSQKNITCVENVQRRSNVTRMTENLKWVILASRLTDATLVIMYRIAKQTSGRNNVLTRHLLTPEAKHVNTDKPTTAAMPANTPSFRASSKLWNKCTQHLFSKQSLELLRLHLTFNAFINKYFSFSYPTQHHPLFETELAR